MSKHAVRIIFTLMGGLMDPAAVVVLCGLRTKFALAMDSAFSIREPTMRAALLAAASRDP